MRDEAADRAAARAAADRRGGEGECIAEGGEEHSGSDATQKRG